MSEAPEAGQADAATEDAAETPAAEAVDKTEDLIADLYRNPEMKDMVVDYFGAVAGSGDIASLILENALAFKVPPALAFAVCWEESRFNPRAVNLKNRNESIDRGLFQLNDRSFPALQSEDFFDPAVNIYYGIGHLRWCLNTGETEIAALAMYNAGTNRVRNLGTPKNTLDYVHRVLEYRQKLEHAFSIAVLDAQDRPAGDEAAVETVEIVEVSRKQRFFRLSPVR
ncbi:MAG: lytic transglycosylase domain-containing protein [Treponema sp.]|nr:lytic transglycosylase domain-containing protein [Treponema sp.]